MKIEELYRIYKECGAISTDSRKLIQGSVFFALKGENFNGNQFALEALEKGCAYAIVDEPHSVGTREVVQRHALTLLTVPNVLASLQELAKYHRAQLKIPFIGITGTNGKTTTRELMAAVLRRKYKVFATGGNLNNHIGVPISVLSVSDHEIAIIEMGANHIGEISALCQIADPDFGIITNIGKAHLDGFGSPEGVIKAKTELYDYLAFRNAKVFIDGENHLLTMLAKERNLHTEIYGNAVGSLCTGRITDNNKFVSATIQLPGPEGKINIQSSLVGGYNLINLLAAAGIGHYFGINPGEIASALSGYKPSNNRSQMMVSSRNKIVMDAYNANPSSMELSIKNFLSMDEDFPKMIILGDMLELGVYARAEHQSVIRFLKGYKFNNLMLVGPEFVEASRSSSIRCFRKVEDLIEHFNSNPVKEHCILLKGSRGVRLEKLLEVL